ncbi:MAG: HAD-IA family hydrolase, partial [Bacteroidia bacterium]|nr:HAD-IA family hydrolase [Bacteroidia bacterium]
LEEQGWKLSSAECMRLFVGKAVIDEAATIQANTGKPVTEAWLQEFRGRRNEGLVESLLAVHGAVEAVSQIHTTYQGRIACASGADRFKVELQLKKCGLMPFFEDRIFSGHEMPRSKPFPDVYLAAAAALGVDPKRCAVIEDTITGVTAGVAAGCTVFGYSPAELGHDAPKALLATGAVHVFTGMADLHDLLA